MPTHIFFTVQQAACVLEVSPRQVRRLADAGAITRVARGLIDQDSVERYRWSKHLGRTRAWAPPTAWAAVAILAGQRATWLGGAQTSRLCQALSKITDVDNLLTRMRERANVHTFDAHRAALPRLRDRVETSAFQALGISDPGGDNLDGYLPAEHLEHVVSSMSLRAAPGGTVTLRVTDFDFDRVRELVATPVVAALDAATSTDPRLRGVGHRMIHSLLEAQQ